VRELGSLEREAMEVVWGAEEPVVVHDVVAALNARRAQPLAYTTVMTVMNNLVAKEWLARHRVGRAFAYRAVEDKDSRTARAMAEALEESADRRAALVGFVGRLDAADAAALRAALEGGE
jgi:predicted transcriptional regulator